MSCATFDAVMWFTVFCCVSTALVVFCVLGRFNKRSTEIATHAAVHEVKKELHERHGAMLLELANKDRELGRLRELLKLHESSPSARAPGLPPGMGGGAGRARKKEAKKGLEMFENSQPFTETTYNAMLRATDVVKIEPVEL